MMLPRPNSQRRLPLIAVAAFSLRRNAATVESFAISALRSAVDRSGAASPMVRAAGGMGMAAAEKKKKSKKNGKRKRASSSAAFDVAKSTMKLEKLYDELLAESLNDFGTDVVTEYVITARGAPHHAPSSAGGIAATDWIPVAQLCLVRRVADTDGEEVLASQLCAAVSCHRREIHYTACLAAPSAFGSLPRHAVEYGAEPLDSFHRHVYEDVVEGKRGGGAGSRMTKAAARDLLGVAAGCTDAARIRAAYRTQAARHHPDRVPAAEKEAASDRFTQIGTAYDTLTSGVRHTAANGDGESTKQSWYESLGGRDRTDFTGPLDLPSSAGAIDPCDRAFRSAVAGFDPELTMAFVARNQVATQSPAGSAQKEESTAAS